MFRNKFYYRIKPLVPWPVRVALRRLFAQRKRAMYRDTWPIMPGSEQPPQNWPGWPDGKKFAFVLTHDVESMAGVAKCRQLMDLDRSLGFRSSFSFIPQGDYSISKILRNDLARNGFEVGVHDLEHDGKLFQSRANFCQKAPKINQFLKDWNAVGFRAGFMLRNLEWLHDLELQYDASTFDTDPFEPQPDGVGTIFPFWVPKPRDFEGNTDGATGRWSGMNATRSGASQGYVELPYTLPQDSTLFLIFGERTPDIWLRKLDWIAQHGGMALLNVHADYVRFDGEPPTARTFPADHYADLLEYVRDRYGDTFWHPLPRELAAFTAEIKPSLRRPPKRVCMVSHSVYRSDMRVMRYAEALAQRGDHVDVLGVQGSRDEKVERVGNVNVYNLQLRPAKKERSKISFLVPLLRFLCSASAWIAREHARRPYDLLHIHNVPDFLVFAAVWPKIAGAKVILDIHDIVPEFYASKFHVRENSLPIFLLKSVERASAKMADRVIISNHLWLEKFASRTGANGKCSVFINNVDGKIFHPRARTRQDDKKIVIFPGGLQWHQGLDIAIRAFEKVRRAIPHAEFHIYGDGNMKETLLSLSGDLGLKEAVRFFDPLPVHKIARIMAEADLGVVPKRADSFGNEAYSTKIMEFMSTGVPVVVSNTRIDRFYFSDSVVRFFESGNSDALAEAMIDVLGNSELAHRMVKNGQEYARSHSWERRQGEYLRLVDTLLGEKEANIPAPNEGEVAADAHADSRAN
jgi:glycosyltransferase involved in cell wall biosynthesis